MKVISHRGFWKETIEKNTLEAFSRSFSLNLGTETDIRDYMGNLVISHDIPSGGEMGLSDFLELASSFQCEEPLTLALNIKADGLAQKVGETLSVFSNIDAFVFDMAVPDTCTYFEAGIPVFARMSEVEREPVWLDRSEGVWLDAFESEGYGIDVVTGLLSLGKRVCLVSSELHGRSHISFWNRIADLKDHQALMICTDYPTDALEYFGAKGVR
jgi:glycerophosphoryl diester phosphodiesterase